MRKTVAIVDDSPKSRAALGSALRRLGFEVVGEGASGAEALHLARTLRPDVLFLAVGLPDMDGLTVAAHILETLPLPILMLSSHLDQGLVRRAKEVGVMAYLLKPLREEELLPAIELAVSRFEEFKTLRQENADLRRNLEDRKLIERAKGILMERERISEQQAFARIQKTSMNTRRSMAEIAQAILLSDAVTARAH
ncbi:MAG: response regulator [Candidatus Methylomirabilota bacterium]|nr:response regulator [Candidatus Methylomirabilis sp.]NJD69075.1 response regulator [candidate division NC10 bacterium]PWB46047.1 MAG: response regulator [candidate division NC10 bacterium]